MINRDLEKHENKAIFIMHCKRTVTMVQCRHKKIMKLLILWVNVLATGEIDLTTGKKIHLLCTFCSYKKNFGLWIINLDFISNSKTFSRSEIWRLFQEFMTLKEPCSLYSTCMHNISDFKAEWPLNKYCTALKGFGSIKPVWCFDHSLTIFPNIGKDQSHLKLV